MAEDIAIRVEHVSKDFVLPHEKVTKVKDLFTSLFRRRIHTQEMQHALKDVSFEVKKGEFFGIVGRNGSGKSTMLKMLAGIYQPTKGTLHVDGKLVPFIELGVGFNPELTGRENVYLNGAMMGFSQTQTDAMYSDIVAFAELEDFMDQKLKNYSSGMQVRLAFSVAIKAEAEILLVDEVLAVGDADFQRKCYGYFKSLKKAHKTVIFVTHDMGAVREYCDRGILIDNARIVAEGSANDIATSYTRIFNDSRFNDSQKNSSDTDKRWGNSRIKIERVEMAKHTYDESELINFKISMKARMATSDPVFGFLIRNEIGVAIAGTNTRIEAVKTRSFPDGGIQTVEWSMPNVFPDGTYYIDPSVEEEDALTVCDWWEGATRFTVRRLRPNPYPIQPDIKVKVL